MPWCPKCNVEYKEGITVCADCNTTLVDELAEETGYISFFMSEHKHIADKLKEYFEYSGVKSKINYSEEQDAYVLSIPEEKQKQAKKLYQAFYFVERERAEKELKITEAPAGEDISEATAVEVSPAGTAGDETPEASVDGEISESPAAEKTLDGSSDEEGPAVPDGTGDDSTEGSSDEEFTEDSADKTVTHSDSDESAPESEDGLLESDEILSDPEGTIVDDLEDEDIPVTSRYRRDSGVYVMKSEMYKEYTSTVAVFTIIGILGLIFVFLNIAGVLTIFSGWLPFTVMSALFLFFIYVGLSTNVKAKRMLKELEEENLLTEQINKWLKDNVTEEYLASLNDESKSEELNYIYKTETIKEQLLKEFNGADPSYLDRLIEEFYNANIDVQAD